MERKPRTANLETRNSAYSRDEREEIILQYFGGEQGTPQCPHCGEALQFEAQALTAFGLQVNVRCPDCERTVTWSQPQPERAWKQLHLEYFLERHLAGEAIRCPLDDCFVSLADFGDGVLRFICPYCNRRGNVKLQQGETG